MSIKHTLIKGTFLLTSAGMVSRLIGFYYRIFLTHAIGAEGIGIYQLIFPVYGLCFSLTTAGIQTTISRLVAANDSPCQHRTQFRIFRVGLLVSLSLAAVTAIFIHTNSEWIAIQFLQEPRCDRLLKILSYAIPLGCIHSAVCGYYYGIKKASIPSITQLVEQFIRVTAVWLMVTVLTEKQQLIEIDIAVWGLVFGEAGSALFSITSMKLHQEKTIIKEQKITKPSRILSKKRILTLMIRQSVPLTMNRLAINILQSVEAILIPIMLKYYGLTTSQALSTYGILTGMALPLVMFPSAITNSVSVMLLPVIAQAQAENKTTAIRNAVENALKYCMLLGVYCTGMFLYFGKDMGLILFSNTDAGKFIVTLAWICPFLYITSTLGSIIHGLGKTFLYFIYNSLSLCIRIGFVIIGIPRIGILGYLWGVLASQLFLTILLLLSLNKECRLSFHPSEHIVYPIAFILISLFICHLIRPLLEVLALSKLILLGINGITASLLYIGLAICFGAISFGNYKGTSCSSIEKVRSLADVKKGI